MLQLAISPRYSSPPMPGPLNDEETAAARLVQRAAGGDRRALAELYELHGGRAYALALRILHAPHDAEEIVQETFLEAWRRAAQYDPGRGAPAAWLCTIARTRALDRLRSRSVGSRTLDGAAGEPPPAPPPTPLETAERRETRERVNVALGTLPPEQRLALELAYFEGLTQTEIAARTGDPLGTVKTRVRLALEKLAGLLGPGGRS